MNAEPTDVAEVRLDNALRLFDEFVAATVKHPDAAALRGLERRFAERLDIQPSHWSQIRARSRQIGERLARQCEQRCQKPRGWMDLAHGGEAQEIPLPASKTAGPGREAGDAAMRNEVTPQNEDERFIVGLVLTYYRRHPQKARTRLLDLLGEVLEPAATPPRSQAPAPPPSMAGAGDLWARAQAGVAPLKRKP